MTKPAGAIEAADGGYDLPGTSDYGIPVRIPIGAPWAAAHWSSSDLSTPLLSSSRQLSIAAGDTVSPDRPFVAGSLEESTAGPKTASWEDYTSDGGHVLDTNPLVELPDYGDDEAPRWGVIGLNADNDQGHGNAEILALYIVLESNHAYADPDPSLTRNCEVAGRNTDADSWRPYDAQRPASSWLLRRMLCNTVNRLAFESRQAFTVPL